jgi:hypothetical protein
MRVVVGRDHPDVRGNRIMSDEQSSSDDMGPEEMLFGQQPAIPWAFENGPADQDAYMEFVGGFGGAGVTPQGTYKQPGEFGDPVFGEAAQVVYETGSLPREMRRAVARRKYELGMRPAGRGHRGRPRTVQDGEAQQELWAEGMDPREDGFRLRLGGEDYLFGSDVYNNSSKDLTEGFYAGVDGMIPVFDFFEDEYNTDSWGVDASKQMGGATRDMMAVAAAAPNLLSWLRNPLLYEAGQVTLPAKVYTAEVAGMTPAARGAELLARGAPEFVRLNASGLATQSLKTIPTGPTPAAALGGGALMRGADTLVETEHPLYRAIRDWYIKHVYKPISGT